MEKKITTLYLDAELIKDLRAREVNLSEFVNNALRNTYRNVTVLYKKEKRLSKELYEVRTELKQLHISLGIKWKELNPQSQSYLKSIPSLLKSGKDIKALWKRFNLEFDNKFTYDEFITLKEYVENEENGIKRY